jgi:hypothetical protein
MPNLKKPKQTRNKHQCSFGQHERLGRRAPKKYSTEEIFGAIAEACKLLGWSISVNRKAKHVDYLIIGKPKVVDELLTKIAEKDSVLMHAGHA